MSADTSLQNIGGYVEKTDRFVKQLRPLCAEMKQRGQRRADGMIML